MAGVLIPLFSVYSENSPAIGDIDDIRLLTDWCKKCGLSIIQLLPMNEVGSTFCPYDSISSFALEPMYISLKGQKINNKGMAKNTHVDYKIKAEKIELLKYMYTQEKDISSKIEFRKFCEENRYWLDDFSMYKVLKDYHNGAPWYEWKEGYRDRDVYMLEEFVKEHSKEIDFYKWVQWTAFRQFAAAKEYANSKNIFIKGDLPILVSRDSADVWAHQRFFRLEYAAGAPPDMYCAKGQRWGVPTYNWKEIEADGFLYMKEKLKFAENFYDLLRIDHVVGLFRIWSIPYSEPLENQGLNGFFDPTDEKDWGWHGKRLLSILQNNTRMLLCAEDLGIIPKVCPATLEELKIPGNEVQRWTKDWEVCHDFLPPGKYRKLSVAMLSTHDTTNWSAWWENEAGTVDEKLFIRKCAERQIDYGFVKGRLFDLPRSKHGRLRWHKKISGANVLADILGKRQEELKDFIEMYENTYMEKEKLWEKLGLGGDMREKSDPDIIKAALWITSASRSVYCIELIFDLLSIDDILTGDPYDYRINAPGTISPRNWSVKIPVPLEKLLASSINPYIKKMINNSDR